MSTFSIVLTWISDATGPCAAVWRSRATDRHLAAAEEYANTLPNGRVWRASGKWTLAEYRAKAGIQTLSLSEVPRELLLR
jgi:hypothetical protein